MPSNDPAANPHHGDRLTDWVGLGVVTRLLHRDLIDDILTETGKTEKRVRLLPSRVVVYFVLGLCLFFSENYEEVITRITSSLRKLNGWRNSWTIPTNGALTKARARLGVAPFEAMFRRIAQPLATRTTHGAWLRGFRLMAIDGFVLDLPSTAANADEFGRPSTPQGPGPFPQARVVVLGECGTHAMIAAEIGGVTDGEATLAEYVYPYCDQGMLLTADRNFFSYAAWTAASATGAHLLWRVKSTLTLSETQKLDDGSYLAILADSQQRATALRETARTGQASTPRGTTVRVIEYEVKDRDKESGTELICLITTITNPSDATALELAAAYHERWEIETTIKEYKVEVFNSRETLRSGTPDLVKQEIWAGLIIHYALSGFRLDAADDIDVDPDRISFRRTLRIIRRHATGLATFSPSAPPDGNR